MLEALLLLKLNDLGERETKVRVETSRKETKRQFEIFQNEKGKNSKAFFRMLLY